MVKKVAPRVGDVREMRDAVEAFAEDMGNVGKYVLAAEKALGENLSRHIGS